MALAKFQQTVMDAKGNILIGASVNLYTTGTTTEVQLYSDRAGTTPVSQPILTDGNGLAEFYVVPGIYDLKAELGGVSTTLTDYEIGAVTLIDDTITDDARVWSSEKIDNAITVAVDAVEIFATQEADRAEAAAVEAENARDAAQLTAGVYDDTTAGLAATSDGDYFSVPSATSDEFLILYRNDAGAATEIDSYPNADAVRKRVIFVPDIAALRALTGVQDGQVADVSGGDVSEQWKFDAGDFSDEVDADPDGNYVVAPDADASGLSGVWRRLDAGSEHNRSYSRHSNAVGTGESASLGAVWNYEKLSGAGFISNATDNMGWAAPATLENWVQGQLPFGVVIGDSIAEGHPGRHGRLHPDANSYDPNYPNLDGQPS